VWAVESRGPRGLRARLIGAGHAHVSPWWPTEGGFFLSFPVSRAQLGPEASALARRLEALRLPGSVFLRGSVVESSVPFAGSDVDVLLLSDGDFRSSAFDGLSARMLDLKPLTRKRLRRDLVQHALVAHRALRVSGPDPALEPVACDEEFAWRHWLAYFPAGLPARIDSSDRYALYHFKCAARSFGVLSLLRDGRYTRDVDACMDFADAISPDAAHTLRRLRATLERGEGAEFSLDQVRAELLRLHRGLT